MTEIDKSSQNLPVMKRTVHKLTAQVYDPLGLGIPGINRGEASVSEDMSD